MTNRGMAGLALCTLIGAGLTTLSGSAEAGDATAQSQTQVQAISWGRCASFYLRQSGAKCGFVTVPLNHADPGGVKIKIAVSRIAATAPAQQRQGPLLVNPGGPGASGLEWSAYLAQLLPLRVSRTYDLIGFDVRGVGASRPLLKCLPSYGRGPRPDFVPTTGRLQAPGANEVRWLKRSKRYAEACAANSATLLPFLRTEDMARDVDLIRQALGATRINYYGFSWGTYLGQVYATLFPTRTRRMVFDGVEDLSRKSLYEAQLDQDRAFEISLGRFWRWVAQHNDVYRLGRTAAAVERQFYRTMDTLRRHPDGRIGPAEWNELFEDAGYAQSLWPDVANAWSEWAHGNHRLFRQAAKEAAASFDTDLSIYLAVQCTDTSWPHDYATWRADGFATAKRAPFFTWSNVWFNAGCIYWRAPSGTSVPISGAATPELLLVNTTLDPATPYAGALGVRRLFPNSALVAQVGSTTHADSLGGNTCVDRVVLRYLRSGKLPDRKPGNRADVSCRRSALPRP